MFPEGLPLDLLSNGLIISGSGGVNGGCGAPRTGSGDRVVNAVVVLVQSCGWVRSVMFCSTQCEETVYPLQEENPQAGD